MAFALAATVFVLVPKVAEASVPKLINFQGILKDGSGNPVANGSYSVTFRIYEVPAGGTLLWAETTSVTTTEGLFAVLLGASNPVPDTVFKGSDRWLGIAVAPDGEMAVRQQLVSVGYAYRVNSVDSASGGTITSKVSIGPGHTNTGADAFVAGNSNTVSGNFSTVGGGSSNTASGVQATVGGGDLNTASNLSATVGGGQVNTASSDAATVGGGRVNTASGFAATVAGGDNNRASDSYATVGGGGGNTASGGFATVGGGDGNTASGSGATVGGGGGNRARGQYSVVSGGGGPSLSDSNSALGDWSAVVGGIRNKATGPLSTVGGGENNTASGGIFGHATIGGGRENTANGFASTIGGGLNNFTNADRSNICGGEFNSTGDQYAAVGGGSFNTASGLRSTVPGGWSNTAAGWASFAAGRQAKANHNGTFVWGDNTASDVASTGVNQFIVRASGGIWLGTNSFPNIPVTDFLNTSTGAHLTTAGVWTDNSDKNRKANFTPVDSRELLEKLARLSINRWNYKVDRPEIKHVGPTAQNFYATFGLGNDDKSIAPLDEAGVALGAIQGLYQIVQEQKEENEELQQELKDLRELVQKLLAEKEEGGGSVGLNR